MIIGVLKETVNYKDQRTALTPIDAYKLLQKFPKLKIKIQPSSSRVFPNEAYAEFGIELNEDLSDCDLLLGVKEVDINSIIPDKTYCFFAHVAKKQAYHQKYLKQLSDKKITLVDYEYITDKNGKRLIAFGYWAGIVGAFYSIVALAKRIQKIKIQTLSSYPSFRAMFETLNKLSLTNSRFIISGTGLTSKGVTDTLNLLGIQKVKPSQFLNKSFNYPVYCQLSRTDYIKHKHEKEIDYNELKQNPEMYYSIFNKYALKADVYLACHYWEKEYPNFLTKEDLLNKKSELKIIADISCDINGPIVSSVKESSHQDPFYDFNPYNQRVEAPFSSDLNINVMAIGNLPNALALESSIDFSKALSIHVLPQLIKGLETDSIGNATILNWGKLSPHFSYLYDFLKSK